MIALIQRVCHAEVMVENETIASIGKGMLILLGVERDDTPERIARLAHRVVTYRLFNDTAGRMNWNVQQTNGSLLIVSQFTLVADTSRGLRPSFSAGADPEQAEQHYKAFIQQCRISGIPVSTGRFAADMQVSLVNDGPVTFLLRG